MGDYMVPAGEPWLSDVRGMFVAKDESGANPVIYWVESGNLMSANLNPSGATAPTTPGGSPPASGLPRTTSSPPTASTPPAATPGY
jgi:hypothetical protein